MRFALIALAAAAAVPAARADGCYGTTVDFVDTPKEAAALAKKQEKLVFLLHVFGRRVAVNNQAIVHQLLAAHALTKIETLYGTVFETILGEQVSTRPVDVVSPFSWIDRAGRRGQR